MSVIDKIKNFYYHKFKHMSNNDILIAKLRKRGMKIGNQTYIFSNIETAEPYLVEIGDNVIISVGVKFTTHDAAIGLFSEGKYSDIFGKIKIGNNCFIGMGSIVLPGVTIADNCIIGAGSVVTKSVTEPYSVLAGNPAQKICTVEEYLNKNDRYGLCIWNMSDEEKEKYIIQNSNRLKGSDR